MGQLNNNIKGGQRGAGHIGAEYWPVLLDRKGNRSAPVFSRYPDDLPKTLYEFSPFKLFCCLFWQEIGRVSRNEPASK